jgi:hypothetical protein
MKTRVFIFYFLLFFYIFIIIKQLGILFTQNYGDFEIGDQIVSVESVAEKIKFKTNEYESQIINRS